MFTYIYVLASQTPLLLLFPLLIGVSMNLGHMHEHLQHLHQWQARGPHCRFSLSTSSFHCHPSRINKNRMAYLCLLFVLFLKSLQSKKNRPLRNELTERNVNVQHMSSSNSPTANISSWARHHLGLADCVMSCLLDWCYFLSTAKLAGCCVG